jgi:tetratricopeptide (TPR) repeat protein
MRRHLPVVAIGALAAIALLAVARADTLRNVRPGEIVPAYNLKTLSGQTVSSAALRGKVVVLIFLSAEQHSSELVLGDAHDVCRDLRRDDLALLFVTADVGRSDYFRALRDRRQVHEPLGLDFDRKVYGDLGLIVQPTTVIIDREGRLAHVISARPSNYAHVLRAYCRHALGLIDDAKLETELKTERYDRDRPEDRIARHRAAARLLSETGLLADCEKELQAALAIDPDHADARLDLAAVLLAMDRTDDAAMAVEAVLRAHPTHRRAKLIEGIVLYHQGRLDEAAPVLEDALLLNPDPVQTHYYLGRIYEQKGDTTRAMHHYKEALSRLIEDRPL